MEEQRLVFREVMISQGLGVPGRLSYSASYEILDHDPSEFGFHFHQDIPLPTFIRYLVDDYPATQFQTFPTSQNQSAAAFPTTRLICSTAIVVAMRTGILTSIIGRTEDQVFIAY